MGFTRFVPLFIGPAARCQTQNATHSIDFMYQFAIVNDHARHGEHQVPIVQIPDFRRPSALQPVWSYGLESNS